MSRRVRRPALWLVVPALAVVQFLVWVAAGASPAQAATARSSVDMTVSSARTVSSAATSVQEGQAVTAYRWMITVDDKGNPSDAVTKCTPTDGHGSYAAPTSASGYAIGDGGANGYDYTGITTDASTCQWPSVRYTPGAVGVVDEGAVGITGTADRSPAQASLPPGKYLVSVTADGYKIDGQHFTVDGSGDPVPVAVTMQPYPLPLGTLGVQVFKDTVPVDGTYEAGTEDPLAGFTLHINDVLGEVTTDFYGNRLCTNYVKDGAGHVVLDADNLPTVNPDNPGGTCVSGADGVIRVPNMGPDRYTVTIVPPAGQKWYQTTTLEGNHDWDYWVQEGEQGYDTEVTVGGENVPPVAMGFVPWNYGQGANDSAPAGLDANGWTTSGGGEITGKVVEDNTYIGGTGGITAPTELALAGMNERGPVANPIVALSDLGNNDQLAWVGRGDANGDFHIHNVPAGTYQATFWDYNQDLIINSVNVTVADGQVVDMGHQGLVDWFTQITGRVCIDDNGNGRCDTGESGVPKFLLTLKERDNSLWDQGQNATTTDDQGSYTFREAYPAVRWSVLEAFNTRYKTTGVTVQADNEPTPTYYTGAGVDISVLPVIGLSGRVDWAVQPYTNGENGGIVGTVTYDTTRNELDPKYAFTEDYQPGIPGLKVHLYYPQRDANGDLVHEADGSVAVVKGADGKPLDLTEPYTTETWQQPTGCTARQYDGTPLRSGVDQLALPPEGDDQYMCVEAPMTGWQVIPSDKTAGAFGQTVNGNYGFGAMDFDPGSLADAATLQGTGTDATAQPTAVAPGSAALPNDDYVVTVESPKLPDGQPLYQVTREQDVNVFDGDQRAPQENYPLADWTNAGAGAVGTGIGAGGPVSNQPGIWMDCAGTLQTVHVTNPNFVANGGSPFEGQQRPLCDAKLVTLRGNQSVAPNFNLFTQVPLPTHYYGVVLNDLGLSHDRTQTLYGEAQPIPDVPVGLYDWAGRLVDTVTTDHNGMYETTVPSTSSFNCPLPAGPCPNVYYFKGNDPGLPGAPNPSYNPRYRTIGTSFQAWPGLFTVTDTAPQQAAAGVTLAPGSDVVQPVECAVNTGAPAGQEYPELFTTENPVQVAGVAATAGDVPAQSLPVSSISVTGSGFTKTATLTVTGLNPTGVPPTVVLPTLTATNAPGVGGLGGALLRAALSGSHQVTAVTATTISFTVAGVNGTLTPVGVSASLPAYHWNAPQTVPATATRVQTTTPNRFQPATRRAAFTLSPAAVRPAGATLLGVPVPSVTGVTTNPALSTVLRNGINSVTTWSANGSPIGSVSGTFTLSNANRSTADANVAFTAPFQVSLSWSGYASAFVGGAVAQPQPLVLHGAHFGATAGTVTATAVDGTTRTATVTTWDDSTIASTIALTPGVYRVSVTGSNGRTTVNGIGLHVLGAGYQPVLLQVNPPAAAAGLSTAAKSGVPGVPAGTRLNFGSNGVASQVDTTYANGTVDKPEDVVQKALDAASAYAPADGTTPAPLVVVWPKTSHVATNAHGDYFENLVVGTPVKLQGVGTGGFQGSTYVRGATLNGLGFNADNAQGTLWLDAVTRYVGATNAVNVADGAVLTYLGHAGYDRATSATNRASLDGFTVTGGDQGGAAPNNLNAVTGAAVTPAGGAGITTQGGGVFLDGHVNNLQVSDNAITGNSGSYAGAIRVGTPYSSQTAAVQGSTELDPNTGLTVAYNRVTDNGGTNLAGGIGLFDGSTGYAIDHNDICGNFSAEYGGGISHYGRSDGGSITFNRIYLNQSYDEGGGVMLAGELNLDQTKVSPGAARQITATDGTGPATPIRIDGNVVERNVANDDGGGLRFLSAGNTPIDVTNNSVVDNISTHEGGGIALDDSTMVRIVGDTVMKNVTTATAVTSNGDPAPAGISTAGNSDQLQATLPSGSAGYSKPFVQNVVLLDNRAGAFAPSLGTTLASVSGSLGTAAATVDKDTTFLVKQTAAGTASIPAPAVNTRTGRRIVVVNTGTATLTLAGAGIPAGGRQAFEWNGTAWATSTVGPLPVDVTGIGQLDDPNPVAVWDLGSTDVGVSGMDAPYSVLSDAVAAGTATQAPVTLTSTGATLTATGDVAVPATGAATVAKNPRDVSVTILNSRTFPAFRQAVIVTTAVSPTWDSDYHLAAGANPAANAGSSGIAPPTGPTPVSGVGHDIDNATRSGTYDIGSDEAF